MRINAINNTNFLSKNTFLTKAKKSKNIKEQHYWESLHYEAKARLNYKKFQNAEKSLNNINDTGSMFGAIALFTAFSTIAFRKLQSVIYDNKAYTKFPNRFTEPDNINVAEERHYKVKENYKYLIK